MHSKVALLSGEGGKRFVGIAALSRRCCWAEISAAGRRASRSALSILLNLANKTVNSTIERPKLLGTAKIVCFDSEPGPRNGLQSGMIYGTVQQQPYVFVYQPIKLLAQLGRGDNSGLPASGKIFIPTLAITRANVKHDEAEQNKLLGGS